MLTSIVRVPCGCVPQLGSWGPPGSSHLVLPSASLSEGAVAVIDFKGEGLEVLEDGRSVILIGASRLPRAFATS